MLRSFLAFALFAYSLAPVQAQTVPTPAQVIGHAVGQSGHLAEWASIRGYFDRLAEASPLVRLERIGESVQGRPMVMAVITAPENHARLEEIRERHARLADPRSTPDDELARLIDTQPAVVFIGASLHGNEIMATQMSMELAHDLATDPELGRALRNVVVLLVPSMNPDGLDITRDWWLRTRQTPHAGAPMPWLYHFYVGHDNNRDFFMMTQPETQAVTRVLYERWFPQVFYDVHQMQNRGPRFFIPPFDDPLNPNVDPLIVRLTNLVGVQMALDLTREGKTGIAHQNRYDMWWHGGGRTVPARHNMVGILSEAANADYGDPIDIPVDRPEQPALSSMYPEPWPGGEWTPRHIVEYELIAAKSLVRLLDRQRRDFVGATVDLARKQIRQGREGGPFAYVVTADQRDPWSAAHMLQILRRGGVEVHEARSAFQADGRSYPAGSRVVLMSQPYRAHAKDLLEPQRYPDMRLYPGGPPRPPYDLAGWTLPMQMGVETIEVERPFSLTGLAPLDSVAPRPGTIRGPASALHYTLDPRMNASHRAVFEILEAGGMVNFAAAPLSVEGVSWPARAPIVWGVPDLPQRVQRWAREWGLDALGGPGNLPHEDIGRLRVALYKPWTASMDEGWTRWVFEEWGVPFDTVHSATVRAGGLRDRFDVVVVPDITYREMMEGAPRAHPDFAGGIGADGARALRDFVGAGGTLILLDGSSEFAIRELGVAVVDVEAAQREDDPERWYAPGSLLRVRWDTQHPIGAGMPSESAIFYARSRVFEVQPGATGISVVASYPERDILMSGYAQGEERIAGRAALVEARIGQGRVVMFGFRPQHRAQPHQTFKPLFNAILNR